MTRHPVMSPWCPPVARPEGLPRSEWPFRTYAVPSGDCRLAISEAGEGPVLLMVHVGTWSFIWRDLVLRLADRFRCIFFDAPGTGQTEGPERGAVSLERAARAVAAVIDGLNLKEAILVAHDLGGPATLAALTMTAMRVRGFVGMNTFGWRPTGAGLRGMLAVMGSRTIREIDVATGFLPRISATAFGVGRHLDEAARATFRRGMDTRGRRSFHDYLRDANHCDALYLKAGRALKGPLAHAPVLTVFGERNDPFGFQRRWKDLFPESRQVVVTKGNHFPMCDAPDFVAEAIEAWYRECVE